MNYADLRKPVGKPHIPKLLQPRLPAGTVMVSRDAIKWTSPDDDITSVRYCLLKDGSYRRIHRGADWTAIGSHCTPVTEAHIKSVAKANRKEAT